MKYWRYTENSVLTSVKKNIVCICTYVLNLTSNLRHKVTITLFLALSHLLIQKSEIENMCACFLRCALNLIQIAPLFSVKVGVVTI